MLYRFLFYGLTTPLGSGCKEPRDGENDPPDQAGDGEKVEQHEEQRAAFALRAQHHRVHAGSMAGFGARRTVSQQEADEVHQRDEAVADRVEDDRPLRVTEALDVDEEGQEREERGAQADDGTHADEAFGKVYVVGFEVHVGARRGAVLGAQERGSQAWLGLQLQRAPESEVSLGWRGHRVDSRGCLITYKKTRIQSNKKNKILLY